MSRPGYWKNKFGNEMAYSDMDDAFVKHVLRYLRSRLLTLLSENINNCNRSYINYCETKLEELGNEAQRRHLIPSGDVTMEHLLVHIAVWQSEWDNRSTSNNHQLITRPFVSVINRPFQSNPLLNTPGNDVLIKVVKTDMVFISNKIEVECEIARVTGYEIRGVSIASDPEMDRRLDTEL